MERISIVSFHLSYDTLHPKPKIRIVNVGNQVISMANVLPGNKPQINLKSVKFVFRRKKIRLVGFVLRRDKKPG